MISCQDFITELGNLLDNDVAAEIREQLEAHLAHCKTCQVLYDSARKTLKIVTESSSFDLSPTLSERMVSEVMSKIRDSAEPRP